MDNCIDFDHMEYRPNNTWGQPRRGVSHKVESLVKTNKIVVFSKTSCPHCQDTKTLLSSQGVEYKAVELDKMEDGKLVQNTLGEITDARTVPRIFINGQCVGGNSDLQSLAKTGQLNNLLGVSDPDQSEGDQDSNSQLDEDDE